MSDPPFNARGERADSLLWAVAQCANVLLREPNSERALNAVLQALGTASGSARCTLLRAEPHPDTGEPAHRILIEWCAPGSLPVADVTHPWIPDKDLSELLSVVLLDQVFEYRDATAPPGSLRDLNRAIGTLSFITLGVFVSGAYWGGLAFDSTNSDHPWSPQDQSALKTATAMMGAAIEKSLLQDQLQAEQKARLDESERRRVHLLAVVAASRQLLEIADFELGMRAWLERLALTTNALEATFYDIVVHAESGTLTPRALTCWFKLGAAGRDNVSFERPTVYDPRGNDTIPRFVKGEVVAGHLEEMSGSARKQYLLQGHASTIAIPIMDGDKCIGGVSFDYLERTELDHPDVEVAKLAADTLAVILKRRRSEAARLDAERDKLAELSRRQVLTEATTLALEQLTAAPDLMTGIEAAVHTLQEVTGLCRVYVFQDALEVPGMRMLCQRCAPGVADALFHPDPLIPRNADFPEVQGPLRQLKTVQFTTESREGVNAAHNDQHGAASDLMVPIAVDGAFWGCIGFDDTQSSHTWSDAEIHVLKGAAAGIASAVKRYLAERDKESKLKRRQQLSEATTKAVECLAAESNLLAGLREAARVLRDGIACDRVFITEVFGGGYRGRLLVDEHAANIKGVEEVVPSLQFDYTDDPATVHALRQGEILFSRVDAEVRSVDFAFNQALGTRHELMVPILVTEELWGCIGFDNCSSDEPFSESDALVLRSAAAGIAAVIQRDRAERARQASQEALAAEQRERAGQLAATNELLSRGLRVLAENATPQSVIEEIARLILGVLGGQSSAVFQVAADSGDETSVLAGTVFDKGSAASVDTRLPVFKVRLCDFPAWPLIRDSHGPTVLRLPQDCNSIHPATVSWMEQRGQRWLLPLLVNGHPAWILAVAGTEEDSLTPVNLERFAILAEQLKLALELKRLGEEAASSAVVEERARLAGEIHDSLAQAFVGTLLLMRAARDAAAAGSDEADDLLLRAEQLTNEGLAQSRRSVLALRPPALENASLFEALALLARKASVPGYVYCRYQGPDQCRFRMPPEHEDQLFRVAQEVVQNTLKHASARHIVICIEERESCVELSISDDGIGFSPPHPHAWTGGLAQMQLRAAACGAALNLRSQPGAGTAVILNWQMRMAP